MYQKQPVGIILNKTLCFCAVLLQISIKISSRRYAEEGLGTTQMCCVRAIKAEGPFVCSRLLVFHLEA